MKKGEVVENIEITGVSADGRAVGKKDGIVVFLTGAAPGDRVSAKILGRRKRLLTGQVTNYEVLSPDRVDPFCEHFGTCGGCKWQHLSYDAQLAHKEAHVTDNLRKLSGMDLPEFRPILGSDSQRFYRNKLEYTFSNRRWLTKEEIGSGDDLETSGLGFHIPGMFDKVLDISKCHLQSEPSNDIRLAVKDYAIQHGLSFYDIRQHGGLLRNLIIRTTSIGQVMVIVQFGHRDSEAINGLLKHLRDTFPTITSLNFIINEKKNDSFYDLAVELFDGSPYIEEKMEELTFRIGPKSFYQTNSAQAHELYKIVREFAGFAGNEVVYDLYTGTGTIANFVAKHVDKVIGIESVPEAVEDAKVNASINGIENTTFHAGDMKDLLSGTFVEQHGRPDVVITDPPRAGMHKNVVECLLQVRPQKIVYVSCNPATQARDMELLGAAYDATAVQPVDMFPHTHHVENVVLLELRK